MPAGNTLFPERLIGMLVSTFILLYSCILIRPVGAVLRNISIDDQIGDALTSQVPKYSPAGGAWSNEQCAGCGVKPDINLLFDHTAMASTYMPDLDPTPVTADFDFNGTAIYIFFTLFYNEGHGTTVNTECNFTLDNEAPVFFNHSGDPTLPFFSKRDYHALVYSKAGLEYKPHHMRISMSDVSYHVFLSFDYAQYTIDDVSALPGPTTSQAVPPSQSSSSPPSSAASNVSKPAVGVILGSALGSLAALVVSLCLLWLYRRSRSGSPSPAAPRPFVTSLVTGSGVSHAPQTREVERTFALSTAGVTVFTSFKTASSTQTQNTDVFPSSSHPLYPAPEGSNGRILAVKHRLHRHMQSLTAEVASPSSRSTKPRTTPSRTADELTEEIRGLQREIQILERSQGLPLGPPPQYDE